MLKRDISVGHYYITKVSNKITAVRIDSESRFGGWNATNMNTNRAVRITSGRRLQREVSVHDVANYQSSKAKRVVHNDDTFGNGNQRACTICGAHTNRPEHELCYSCWADQKRNMTALNRMAPSVRGGAPKPGDTLPVSGGTITLMGRNVSEEDVVSRMHDRLAPVISALRTDADALHNRGFGDYSRYLSDLAYAVENDMLEAIGKLI